jgi:ATP-dependent Zn protease
VVVVIDDERQRVAFHEAGHGLLAVLLEIPLTALSLRPGDGFRAVTVFDPTEAAPDLD